MRRAGIFLALAFSGILNGCIFTGGVRDSDIVELESRVQSLNQRINQLEAGRSVSSGASAVPSSGFDAAEDVRQPDQQPAVTFGWWGAMNKLVRGLTNVFTGWVEIPKRMQQTSTRSGALSGFTWGLLRGLGHGFIRTAGGAYETVTFPFPAPPGYQSVIQPPYVFVSEEPQAPAY